MDTVCAIIHIQNDWSFIVIKLDSTASCQEAMLHIGVDLRGCGRSSKDSLQYLRIENLWIAKREKIKW